MTKNISKRSFVRNIIVDTSPLVALFNKGDRHHDRCLRYFEAARDPFTTNIAVITEVSHLLKFSPLAARDCLTWIQKTFEIDNATPADLPRVFDIMAKYADLPADFADASLVALCERTGIEHIATLDRDFDVYRLANGKPLVNVFASP